MMIAALNRADRTVAVPRSGVSGMAGFDALLTTHATASPARQTAEFNARTEAAAAVASFDLGYSNVEHSQAEFDAYYAEGARQVSAAQGLPAGQYDFSAMSPRELRIVTGHLVTSGAVKFGDVAHLTLQVVNIDGSRLPDRPTDWYAVVDDQIASAKARHEDGVIPYLQSAVDALQRFQAKSDRPAGVRSIVSSVPLRSTVRLDAALEAFRKERRMTPAERVRRQVLQEMRLAEADLKAMPAEQRDPLEKTIGEEVALRLKTLGIDLAGAGTRTVAETIAAQG